MRSDGNPVGNEIIVNAERATVTFSFFIKIGGHTLLAFDQFKEKN